MRKYRHLDSQSAEVDRLRRELETVKARSLRESGGATLVTVRPSDPFHFRGDGSSANPRDDEFAAAQGDDVTPTGWLSVQDTTRRWAWGVRWDQLYGYSDGSVDTTGRYEALLRPLDIAIPPVTIEGIFRLPPEPRTGLAVGVVFSDTDEWGSGAQIMAGVDNLSGDKRLVYRPLTNWTAGAGAEEAALPHDWLFVRLVWTAANTFRVLYSSNGITWKRWDSAESVSRTMTPVYGGIAVTSGSDDDTQPTSFSCHAYRMYYTSKDETSFTAPPTASPPEAPSNLTATAIGA